MIEQEWIGIQFNFDKDMKLKAWLEKYSKQGVETDEQHIIIKFGKNELKNIADENSLKIKLIKSALRKYLKYSEYTNIYTYLDAENISKYKSSLLNGEFIEPIRVDKFNDRGSILANYKSVLNSPQVRKVLRKDKLMLAMNKIFSLVIDRGFAVEQKLTLEIGYEAKEEWGVDNDSLNVSIQLSELKNQNK